jgi:hypothetical protein
MNKRKAREGKRPAKGERREQQEKAPAGKKTNERSGRRSRSHGAGEERSRFPGEEQRAHEYRSQEGAPGFDPSPPDDDAHPSAERSQQQTTSGSQGSE